MGLYKQQFNPITGNFDLVPTNTAIRIRDAVASQANLPVSGNVIGDGRVTIDTGRLYLWSKDASSGLLTDWIDQGNFIDVTWDSLIGKPSSTPANIDDAVSKRHSNSLDHTQNSDTKLAEGTGNEVTAANAKDAVDKKHTQGTDQGLDTGGANAVTVIDVKDAVTKRHSNSLDHTQNTDVYLNNIVSKTFYVDNKRVDSYTEDGTITKPFKTIQAAINKVISNGDNSQTIPYTIRIATGVYPENVILESANLVSLIIIGEGSRLQTQINPSSGYALQSIANNANFYDLHMENIQFIKPTIMVGSANNNYFGYNFFFINCYWPSTALATFKNMTYPSFIGNLTKFSGGLLLSNITQCSMEAVGGIKTAAFTIETDESANKPYLFGTGTAVLCLNMTTPNTTWSLLNIVTKTGTALQVRSCRHGSAGETIPLNAQILAHNSTLIGNYVNNGTLTLYNSQISGTFSGTAPVLYQSGNQIKNTPAGNISATTVQAAIDELDTEKLAKNSEIAIKLYSQNSEPTLAADNNLAIWIDTDDSNRVYLLYRRGSGDQVAVELG